MAVDKALRSAVPGEPTTLLTQEQVREAVEQLQSCPDDSGSCTPEQAREWLGWEK